MQLIPPPERHSHLRTDIITIILSSRPPPPAPSNGPNTCSSSLASSLVKYQAERVLVGALSCTPLSVASPSAKAVSLFCPLKVILLKQKKKKKSYDSAWETMAPLAPSCLCASISGTTTSWRWRQQCSVEQNQIRIRRQAAPTVSGLFYFFYLIFANIILFFF